MLNIMQEDSDSPVLKNIKQQSISLKKGDCLYVSGKMFKYIYVVKHGAVKTISEEGRVIDFHLQGEFLGLDGFEDNVHQLDAIAIEDTLVCAFNFQEFLSQTDSFKEANIFLSQLFAKQFNNKVRHSMYPKDASQRICQLLLRLADHNKKYGYVTDNINLPMQRKDMANYLELTLETVSRALLALRNDGIIEVHNRQVQILNEELLLERSGLGKEMERVSKN
jgi:CRP/FNR family transcriptional regulator